MSAGEFVLNMKFAEELTNSYTKADLQADLAAGVEKIIAGIGSNYRLRADSANGVITIGHVGAVYNGAAAAGGGVRPMLGITAAGLAMGYNDDAGVWHSSIAIDASGNASFSGAINATSGNFTGTITAGSVITDTVTVGGTALSIIKSGAALGATSAQAATTTAALNAKLNNASATIMASGFSLKTPNYDSTVAGTGGMAIYENGIIGRKRNAGNTGWDTTITIGTDGNVAVKGDISGSTGTFAGTVSAANITAGTITAAISINSSGSINATGLYSSALGNASVCGVPSSYGHGVAGVANGSGTTGVYGSASVSGSYGVFGQNTAASGIGIYAYCASGTDLLLGGSGKIAFTATNYYIKNSSGVFRVTDSTSTDAYMLMIGSATLASGSGATLGAKLGANSAQTGWFTCKVNGSTVYVPYWS